MEVSDAELNLDAVINVRVTAEEKDALRAEASAAGTTLSDLVRRRCLGLPVVAHVDEQMVRELRRLGGLLKHMYAEQGGYSPELANAANALSAFMARHIRRVRS